MTVNRIETDVVYKHEKYGDVLVTGIAKMYEEWDTSGPQDDLESGEVMVFFYDEYDGYGGMNPMPFSQNINEFSKLVERKGVHDYIDTSELYMEGE